MFTRRQNSSRQDSPSFPSASTPIKQVEPISTNVTLSFSDTSASGSIGGPIPLMNAGIDNNASLDDHLSQFGPYITYRAQDSIPQADFFHKETRQFLQRHFSYALNQDYNLPLPIKDFVRNLIKEFGDLWGNEQGASKYLEIRLNEIWRKGVPIAELASRTLKDGIVGLVVKLFKQAKTEECEQTKADQNIQKDQFNTEASIEQATSTSRRSDVKLSGIISGNEAIDNLKQILQEQYESQLEQLQTRLSNKINGQLRRLVLKYRETQRLLHDTTELVNSNLDIISAQKKWKGREKQLTNKVSTLEEEVRKKTDLAEQTLVKLVETQSQVARLRTKLQKYETAVLNRLNKPETEQAKEKEVRPNQQLQTQIDLNISQVSKAPEPAQQFARGHSPCFKYTRTSNAPHPSEQMQNIQFKKPAPYTQQVQYAQPQPVQLQQQYIMQQPTTVTFYQPMQSQPCLSPQRPYREPLRCLTPTNANVQIRQSYCKQNQMPSKGQEQRNVSPIRSRNISIVSNSGPNMVNLIARSPPVASNLGCTQPRSQLTTSRIASSTTVIHQSSVSPLRLSSISRG